MIIVTKTGVAKIDGLRRACAACNTEVWRQGAAWGFTVPTFGGLLKAEKYLPGALDDSAANERLATLLALKATSKGRKTLKAAGIGQDILTAAGFEQLS